MGKHRYRKGEWTPERRREAPQERRRIRHNEKKARLVALMGGRCQDCGIIGPPCIYHFDHRDPSRKVAEIGLLLLRPWDRLYTELAKCDMVCANCHAIRSFEDQRIRAKMRVSHSRTSV